MAPSGLAWMPRGRFPTGIRDTTLRVARSTTATSPPISLLTYNRGPVGCGARLHDATPSRATPARIEMMDAATNDWRRDCIASRYQQQREPVVPLDADCLQRRGVGARLGGRGGQEAPPPLHVGGVGILHQASVAHDVIDDDDAAGMGQLHRPLEILGGGRFVGVDEEKIERLSLQRRQGVDG